MIISHNLLSVNAYNKLSSNMKRVAGISEKLASGCRINKSADDASGLAVSEKLRSQLRGLKQASRNCQDGINLVQTFDGALGESHSIIQRAKELAAEAANGTYDNPADRAAIELEYKQLCKELNNIADTDFNGLCLLNGGSLASAEENGMYWANPTDLKWKNGSFVNQTDDPNFNMTIEKLPALDEMTMITTDEKEALCEFNGANIGVDLNDGTPVFKFNAPIPQHLTIKTDGLKGRIYMNTVEGLTAVADVHLSGIDVTFSSKGKGSWISSTGSVKYNMPESQSNKGKMLSAAKPSDPLTPFSDKKTDDEALRREYHDWLESIPGSDRVLFKVTDDRKHFKIVRGADTLRISDGKGGYIDCKEDVEYERGTTLYTTTNNANSNTSGKSYEWKNWSFAVSWTEETVQPGGTLYLTTSGCSESSTEWFYGSVPPKENSRLYAYFDIFGMSSNCRPSGVPANDEDAHSFWLLHGGYSFTFSYNVTDMPTGNGYWTATVRDGRGNTLTYDETQSSDKANFTALKNKLKAGTDNMKSIIQKAHEIGYFTPVWGRKYDKQYWPPANQSRYSFTYSISAPRTSTDYTTSWYPSYENTTLNLGEYNPANPDIGGIEAESGVSGTFTYKNPDLVNTRSEGYWVDQNGNTVDLDAIGIHLPKAYSKKVLSSEDAEYLNPYVPLHDGLSITVGTSLKGPTGSASATVHIWEGDDNITPLYDDNLSDYGLTYAENLDIQSNSRSKDIVRFTFKYNSSGMGELICDTNCSANALGMNSLTLSTQDDANLAVDKIEYALNKVSMVRACFGSIQNRLEKKIENIAVTNENITESESHIRDADMAKLMTDFTKANLLSSVSQSMLAQSNLMPQQLLQLIK